MNSNYSVIFRWWDALNRSLLLNVPQDQITMGVAGYLEREDNGLWRLLVHPFRRRRRRQAGRAGLAQVGQRQQTSRLSFMAE